MSGYRDPRLGLATHTTGLVRQSPCHCHRRFVESWERRDAVADLRTSTRTRHPVQMLGIRQWGRNGCSLPQLA